MKIIKHNGIMTDGQKVWVDGKIINDVLYIFDIKGSRLIDAPMDWSDPHRLTLIGHWPEGTSRDTKAQAVVSTFIYGMFEVGGIRLYNVSKMQTVEDDFIIFDIECSFKDLSGASAK